MLAKDIIRQMAEIVERRLGGNLRMLAVYGSAADAFEITSDLDFILVVDYVENCVAIATSSCRDIYPSVQFFVLSASEYAVLPRFFRFQFAFATKLLGDLTLPSPNREDAVESIEHGFVDSLRTLRQQFKRRDWTIGDDWARQTWWNLKSFKYALLDVCWLIRGSRTRDPETASIILLSEGLDSAATAILDWPRSLELAAQQLCQRPSSWVMKWEARISAAYTEVRPLLER